MQSKTEATVDLYVVLSESAPESRVATGPDKPERPEREPRPGPTPSPRPDPGTSYTATIETMDDHGMSALLGTFAP